MKSAFNLPAGLSVMDENINPSDDGWMAYQERQSNGKVSADSKWFVISSPRPRQADVIATLGAGETNRARAVLLAAAPDMLEALNSFPQPGLPGKEPRVYLSEIIKWWNEVARAAAVKAEGGE